jgi:phage tail sheath protein FI
LQEAQINLIRQEPRGFLPLSADTLSRDAELRPIGVRRLLSLLRRLALRHGTTYVFEPNNDAFRRLVQRGFEAMLEELFMRGAFAGATPELAYQVTTDDVVNSPQSIEQGRFIVELKVAPSLPLTFLTIRLVQAGERGLTTEEVG